MSQKLRHMVILNIDQSSWTFHMDIRKSRIKKLVYGQKVSNADVKLLEKIIDELTEFFNRENALVKKYKTSKILFDEMDHQGSRELRIIFNENARLKGTHERT